MRWWKGIWYWAMENRIMRKLLCLQHVQTEEHHKIVAEVKESRRQMTTEMSEVIFKLSAVTDRLEEQLGRNSD